MIEEYRDINGYEGLYQVSNIGNVKSVTKKVRHWKGGISVLKERTLKLDLAKNYLQVSLIKNGSRKRFRVHQLVAMAFLGHEPDGTHKVVVDHINDDKLDNNLSNLQLTTNRHNVSKSKKGGTSKYTGVSWNAQINKWKAQISINGKNTHIGVYRCEVEASKAYQKALSELN